MGLAPAAPRSALLALLTALLALLMAPLTPIDPDVKKLIPTDPDVTKVTPTSTPTDPDGNLKSKLFLYCVGNLNINFDIKPHHDKPNVSLLWMATMEITGFLLHQ